MTHLWPSMVRKPLAARADPLPAARESLDYSEEDDVEAGPSLSSFPVSFDQSQNIDRAGRKDDFPDLAELRAQIEMDDFDRFERDGAMSNGGRIGRLEMLDDLLGMPGMEEYARLDEWLDSDEEGEGGHVAFDGEGFVNLDEERQARDESFSAEQDPTERHLEEGEKVTSVPDDATTSFEDDFDDFAAFQSAPKLPSHQAASGLTMDPTPLLLHLQSVRAELAGLGEEERRIRAGKEVARVMRDLGFDNLDATDLLGDDGELIE